MPTGLREEWGLKDAKAAPSTKQADEFKAAYQAKSKPINEDLQYTAVNGEKPKHAEKATQRDDLASTYQAVLVKIDPRDPSKAKAAIDTALAKAASVANAVAQFKREAEKALNDWLAKEPLYEKAVGMIEELEQWGDKSAATLRAIVDAIRKQVNDKIFNMAVKAVEALMTKLQPIYDEYLKQKAAKEKYDPELAALQPQLAKTAECRFAKLEPMQKEIAAVQQKMEAAATEKNYVQALQLLGDLRTKVEAYLAAVEELEKKKAEYERALAALQPNLTKVSTCEYKSLAELDQQIADLTTQMEKAAAEDEYEQALQLLNQLSAKVEEKLTKVKEIEAKKAEYETARQTLDPKLAEASTCQFKTLAELDQQVADLTGKTDAAAAEQDYEKALTHGNELSAKVDEKLTKAKEIKDKKAEYEAAVKALQPKLPSACPVNAKLSALDSEITALKGQMEAAAASEDYAKALELAKQLTVKADEFQKALAEFEKNKQEYEAALKALQPKLPTTCPVNAGLAEQHSQIMALKGQMEAAASSQDYVKALELAKKLTAKADHYQKSLKEKPPSPEKVKEVQDLITAGKKDDAIKKAMEVYGVDKSQAKSIVYDSSVSGEAVASKDGSVRVGDKAFASPGWLASSAAHELEIHVNKQAKADKWYTGKMGTAIQEVQAYDHEIANAHKYNLTHDEIKDLKKRRQEHYDELNAVYKTRADEGNYDMKPGEEGL